MQPGDIIVFSGDGVSHDYSLAKTSSGEAWGKADAATLVANGAFEFALVVKVIAVVKRSAHVID